LLPAGKAEFIAPRHREQLRRMIGFRFENGSKYPLPANRLRAIEKHLQTRVQALREISEKH
jgi:hypothetical protein